MTFLSTWGCYYSHIISWSVRGLDRPSLIHFSAFFQRGDDLFDIVVYRENCFVFLEKVVDPGFSEERKSLRLSWFDVAVVVKNSDLILRGLLFMLKDELLDVFTSFEELLFIFYLEDSFGPLLPRLSLDDW